MKKLIIILTVLLSSCGEVEPWETTPSKEISTGTSHPDIEVTIIDGHEYLLFSKIHPSGSSGGSGICHSESCSCKTDLKEN